MEVVANQESTTGPAAQPQSAWLKFPDGFLPKLSVVQATADTAYFEVFDGDSGCSQ